MTLQKLLLIGASLAFCASAFAAPAPAAGSAAAEAQFGEVYKELVETNTTLSAGSCTRAADRMAARLKSAGFTDADLNPFAIADHPQEGGLVAIYPGNDRKLKAILPALPPCSTPSMPPTHFRNAPERTSTAVFSPG
jgi:hypothetical protein